MIAPTTTTKIAARMLAASAVIAARMPVGLYHPVALDTLLALHVAEEEARYPRVEDVCLAGPLPSRLTERWVAVLVQAGLVQQGNGLLALTTAGHDLVSELLGAVYDAQRELD